MIYAGTTGVISWFFRFLEGTGRTSTPGEIDSTLRL